MTRLFALPLFAFALPAMAELPPCEIDALMREAPVVVQITDHRVETFANNICALSGTVAQVHRGDVDIGQSLRTTFECVTDPTQVAIGGVAYANPRALASRGAVEVHIGADGFIAAFGAGLIGLSAPTQTIAWEPSCN